jgi:hypothetical protein
MHWTVDSECSCSSCLLKDESTFGTDSETTGLELEVLRQKVQDGLRLQLGGLKLEFLVKRLRTLGSER